MKTSLFTSAFSVATTLVVLTCAALTAGESTIKFSDPSRPGQIVVRLGMGDVTIHGGDTDVVTITSEETVKGGTQTRDDGLRRLDGDGGFSVGENDNVITVTLANLLGGRRGDASDLEITVPRNTKVTLERAGPGDTEIRHVEGDLEIRGPVGDLELSGVVGGVLVDAVNGDIRAEFLKLTEGKPVSITVVHGDVELRVPAAARANVRFRTLRGEMLTDFAETELQTQFENTGMVSISNADVDHDRIRADVDRARAQVDQAQAVGKQTGTTVKVDVNVRAPIPPVPPMPPLPPMAGGKLVVGKLNGGGTELIVTSLHGDITLRKN